VESDDDDNEVDEEHAPPPPAPKAKKIHSKSPLAANFDEEEIKYAPSHPAPAVAKKTQFDSPCLSSVMTTTTTIVPRLGRGLMLPTMLPSETPLARNQGLVFRRPGLSFVYSAFAQQIRLILIGAFSLSYSIMFYYTSANIMALDHRPQMVHLACMTVNGSQALLRLSSFNKLLNPQQPFRALHGHNSLLIASLGPDHTLPTFFQHLPRPRLLRP